MHRPERLRRLIAFVSRQLERSSPALPPKPVALGFSKDFSVLCTDFGRFRVRDRAQSLCKCCVCKAMNLAIAALRQAAGVATPRCESTTTRVWLCSGNVSAHRRFSNAAENPIWNDQCTLGK